MAQGRWGRVLDRAEVWDRDARTGYTVQRRAVRRFAPAEYTAVRLLLPAPLQPDVVILVAFMHATDDRIDRGPRAGREAALRAWRRQVHSALESGTSPVPGLRILAHTVGRHPALRGRVAAFLDGAEAEVGWERFGSEADVDRYVREYSLPALMLSMGLLAPAGDDGSFEEACLALITAMQRLDFLEDLAEDLAEGRIGLSDEALAAHGLSADVLRTGKAPAGQVSALITSRADVAARALAAARPLTARADRPARPFVRALLDVQKLRLAAVRRAGTTLTTRTCGPSPAACGAVLLRELLGRRAARRPRTGARPIP
ncbi:squalene/phytoene synthase family protein [Streptomyces sp. NPDC058855]|uniref:squalene/phytoene synthase family protein n=1 Tax=Streptomyces sp. NPDC058855 TaxID=3346651 RepID=UPI0036CD2335